MTMPQLPAYATPRAHRRQLVSLPSRSHDACGPTFGCAVYVGHAAILQLHRLSILKGKRFCNESNACLSLELGARQGSSMGAACPPHLSARSLGGCTRWFRPRAGSLVLRAASLLWRWKWREVGQAQKRAANTCLLLAEA